MNVRSINILSELVGRKVLRTKETVIAGGNVDRSFMTTPILIIKVTPTHVYYQSDYEVFPGKKPDVHVLSYEYMDRNWIEYDPEPTQIN